VIVDFTGAGMKVRKRPEQKLVNSSTTLDISRVPVISQVITCAQVL